MARRSDNVVPPSQKRANDTGPNALGSAGDNDSLVRTFDFTLLSSDFFRDLIRICFFVTFFLLFSLVVLVRLQGA